MVVIADDRTAWMKQEDKWAACFYRCPLFKNCSSRFGMDCKRLGGTKIAKVRDGNAKKSKAEKKA
ncbi:hypothetical protein BTR25_13360 [Bacillus sp. MRMR6]|nr:hypothetical protein BTR25_13360 [Bacillus sp. MRMR6]